MARLWLGLAVIAGLSGCSFLPDQGSGPKDARAPQMQHASLVGAAPPRLSMDQAARNFAEVLARLEPVAEAACRKQSQSRACDFQIGVDMNTDELPNAYQTLGDNGRPQIIFTISLIAEARNSDELAFVLGHEAAHHILGHLATSQKEALNGAILGGILASVTGGNAKEVERAQQIGAQFGALRFSKEHELEADELGTILAYQAGYNAVVGAEFFNRLPDPGAGFLNSHPGNDARQAVVYATYARVSGQ